MERYEADPATLELYLDSDPLRRELGGLDDELQGAFDAMGRAAAGRFEVRTAPVRQIMADWARQTAALKSQFESLGSTLKSTFVIAMTPAIVAMNSFRQGRVLFMTSSPALWAWDISVILPVPCASAGLRMR